MITSIEGRRVASGVDWIDIAVGPVTLRVRVPQPAAAELGRVDSTIRLHTYLMSKEDGITLFGFPTEDERTAFELLIGVTGIGPRLALAVLSRMSPEALSLAVASGDTATFKGIPGVGARTAARILVDMKGKLDTRVTVSPVAQHDVEVVEALTALGYTIGEARDAVSTLPPDSDMAFEERIRISIQRIATG